MEKRQYNRMKLFTRLVKITDQDHLLSIGSLTDISYSGIVLLINNDENTNNIISQPFEVNVIDHNNKDSIILNVNKVWEKNIYNNNFKKIGCYFNYDSRDKVLKIMNNISRVTTLISE